MKDYIIYISGLGDGYDVFRSFFLKGWRVFGVRSELVGMRWNNGETYEQKADRIKQALDTARQKGYRVSLVGESAGASIAMNVFADDQAVHRFVSLCGVNTSKTPISPTVFKRKPAFHEAIRRLDAARDRAVSTKLERISVVTSLKDPSVPVRTNLIPGAGHTVIWLVGHLTTIAFCLSLGSYVVVRAVTRS
jgi:dienelactone hydrolase